MKIRVLDEITINKIAAGEVIENTASVVKELVENSIDAGSTDICVEIKGGGRQLIRVRDNGCGMTQDDALLCLERHATSKIRNVEDILSVETMGFRGEAVPSIASISKFTLMTFPKASPNSTGTMVLVEGGKILQCCPVVHDPGTTIEVKSLFYNVPVRRKFQRSPAYDANEVLKVICSLALGYPQIRFQLISDQKNLINTHVSDHLPFQEQFQERIKEILGTEFLEMTQPIFVEKEKYVLQGHIGLPAYVRPNKTGQHLFINKRAIFSPLVSYAIRNGYGTTIPSNRHPIYALHLTLPGNIIDVNVHPQKREVRLRQEIELKEMITEAIRKNLNFQENVTSFSMPDFTFTPLPTHISKPFEENTIEFSIPVMPQKPIEKELLPEVKALTIPKVAATMKNYIFVDPTTLSKPFDGMCLVDQRAAHRRVHYEKLLRHDAISVQNLLIPYSYHATPFENALLLDHLEVFNQMGISMHQSGPNNFLIDAIPSFFENLDLPAFIHELINDLQENQSSTLLQQERHKKIALAACQKSISSKERLSVMEAQSLINQLMQCEFPLQCPLRKAIFLHIDQEEIQNRFQKEP